MKYLKLSVILAFVIVTFTNGLMAQTTDLMEVEPVEALKMVKNGALMVDVREPSELAEVAYDVENIIHIPLGQLKSRMNEIPKDREVIMACRSGHRSSNAVRLLQKKGYTNIINLKGGILGWQANNLSVIKKE